VGLSDKQYYFLFPITKPETPFISVILWDKVLSGLLLNRLINNVLLLKSIRYRHLRPPILNLIAWEVLMKSIMDYSCAQISTNFTIRDM